MRKEKQLLLDGIKNGIKESKAIIVMSYDRIDPNLADELRMNLHSKGAQLLAVPKRLFIKAASEAGITFDRSEGHVVLVLAGEDTIGAAKAIYDFKKANKNKLNVIGGHFEGKVCPEADVEAIANLPSQDEMRAQLLGVFEAPLSGLVGVCAASMSGVVSCIGQKADKS